MQKISLRPILGLLAIAAVITTALAVEENTTTNPPTPTTETTSTEISNAETTTAETPVGSNTTTTGITELNGKIGINNTNPERQLDVIGGVKLSVTTGEMISLAPDGEICLGQCTE